MKRCFLFTLLMLGLGVSALGIIVIKPHPGHFVFAEVVNGLWDDPDKASLVFYHDFQATNATQVIDAEGNFNADFKPSTVAGPTRIIAGTNSLGTVNYCYDFDGTDDRFNMAHGASQFVTNGFTISAWVQKDQTDDYEVILSKIGTSAQNDRQYVFYFTSVSSGQIRQLIYGNAATTIYIEKNLDDASADGGAWHHLVGVWDGNSSTNSMNLYLDGTNTYTSATEAGTWAELYTSAVGMSIGTFFADQTYPFDGRIDNVRLYNTNLSPLAITNLFTYNHPTNDMVQP